MKLIDINKKFSFQNVQSSGTVCIVECVFNMAYFPLYVSWYASKSYSDKIQVPRCSESEPLELGSGPWISIRQPKRYGLGRDFMQMQAFSQ